MSLRPPRHRLPARACEGNLEILQQLNSNKSALTRSPATLLRQMQASSKYEAWFNNYIEENSHDNTDPYHKDNFTIDKLVLYTIERSQCSAGVDGGAMKVQSVFVDFKNIVAEAKDHGFEVPKQSYGNYYAMCLNLSKMGLLSTNGRKKVVVGVKETKAAVKTLLESEGKDVAYNLQVSLLLLIILYSGVRLSSLMPKEKCLEHEQRYLKWKDIRIYRQGRDEMGDQITVKVTFPHVKCKDNVLNSADHEFTRSFTTCRDKYTDLPAIMVSFLISRNYLKEDFKDWYLGGKVLLEVKEEVLQLPLFCRNEMGGHDLKLSKDLWFGQYACKAISKAYRDANVAVPVTGYALRRNFIQTAQTVTDDKKAAVLAGHQPQSIVQYTKYGSAFDTLDIVNLVKESRFGEVEQANDYIHGMRCTVKVYGRLSKEEYEAEVLPFFNEEKQDLDKMKKALKEKYKTLDSAYTEWTSEEKTTIYLDL